MKRLLLFAFVLQFVSCSKNDRVLLGSINFEGVGSNRVAYYQGELFDGIAYTVYPNGTLHYEAEYRDGKKNGVLRNWDSDGRLLFSEKYINGECVSCVQEDEVPAEEGSFIDTGEEPTVYEGDEENGLEVWDSVSNQVWTTEPTKVSEEDLPEKAR